MNKLSETLPCRGFTMPTAQELLHLPVAWPKAVTSCNLYEQQEQEIKYLKLENAVLRARIAQLEAKR